ncbi:hypothetical protein AQB9606_03645 [Aquabacterium sp. CECT 9606]|nr:hypothetical protein AQB9606_03645 [Aquabacterium sp. CECT 9606]
MSTTLLSRNMGLRRKLLAFVAATGLAASAQAATSPPYRFVELGVEGGEYASGWVAGINNVGQAVGGSWVADVTSTMVWTETSAMQVSSYSGGLAINDLGAGVGYNSSRRGNQASYWDNSVVQQLRSPGDINDESQAESINLSGQIVGTGSVSGTAHALVWQSHSAQAAILPSVGGAHLGSSASAINDAGLVVGRSEMDFSQGRATLWTSGVPTDLGVLHEGDGSAAFDINNAGQIIGDSGGHAVRWDNGNITELGLLAGSVSGAAGDINNLGQIVGSSYKGGQAVATLWDGQSVIDLNQYAEGSEWVLVNAVGINDQGWVVGNAQHVVSGVSRPYMLIPSSVPEPNAVVLSLLGGGALALAWRRKKKTPV